MNCGGRPSARWDWASLDIFVPRVLGVGYDTIGDILNGNLALKASACRDGRQSASPW